MRVRRDLGGRIISHQEDPEIHFSRGSSPLQCHDANFLSRDRPLSFQRCWPKQGQAGLADAVLAESLLLYFESSQVIEVEGGRWKVSLVCTTAIKGKKDKNEPQVFPSPN